MLLLLLFPRKIRKVEQTNDCFSHTVGVISVEEWQSLWGQPLGVAVGSVGPNSQAELANSATAQGGSQSRLGHLFLFLTTSGILWKCL